MLLEAFDSNWIAPDRAGRRRLRARDGREDRRRRTPWPSPAERRRSTSLCCWPAWSAGTRCSFRPSPSSPAPRPSPTWEHSPVFVDCSADSWNLDPDLVEEVLVERAASGRLPAAVITVDLYGETADYAALESLCRRFEVPLIEDSAEALGSTYRGRAAGSFGVAGIFSFNGNKIITTSGGGMLVTEFGGVGRASPPSGHAGQGAVLPLRAHRGGVQLPPLQPAGRPRAGPSSGVSTAASSAGSRSMRRTRPGWPASPGSRSCRAPQPGTSNYWLTCILIDPGALRSGPRAGPAGPRGRGHRVPTDVEAPSPPTGLRRGHVRRAGALRPGLRPGPVPAHRVGALARRPVPGHRDHRRLRPAV